MHKRRALDIYTNNDLKEMLFFVHNVHKGNFRFLTKLDINPHPKPLDSMHPYPVAS